MKVLFLILLFLVLCPALYFYCIMPRFTRKEQTKRFAHQLFAHRGLFNPKLGIPENSMPAFSRAIEKGYGIELDVQVTKDNRIVVFHDYSLGRMCGIDIPLETKTYAELQELCLQNTRETIPLLSDVLKLVNGQVPLLVEIKFCARGRPSAMLRSSRRDIRRYTGVLCGAGSQHTVSSV